MSKFKSDQMSRVGQSSPSRTEEFHDSNSIFAESGLERLQYLEGIVVHERELRLFAEADRREAEERLLALDRATSTSAWLRQVMGVAPSPFRRFVLNIAKLGWWIVSGRLFSKLRARRDFKRAIASENSPAPSPYLVWSTRFDTPNKDQLARAASAAKPMSTVLVVVRFDFASSDYAAATFAALNNQAGVICFAQVALDQTCTSEQVKAIQQAASGFSAIGFSDPRTPLPAHILFVQGGALPRAHGAWALAHALARPKGKLAYSDEDFLDAEGLPSDPWFKPSPSRLLLEQDVLLGRMVALKPGADEVQALVHSLIDPQAEPRVVLRNFAAGLTDDEIIHVRHVLFHNALPLPKPQPLNWELIPAAQAPMVSVLIPSRDRWDLLGPCLESITTSHWPLDRLEIIVIDNGSAEPSTLDNLRAAESAGQIRVVRDDGPFNFPRLINTGAAVAGGEILLLLNNDTEVLDRDWIAKLVAYAARPDIGVVGAKLLYPDRTVQHAGVVLGLRGGAGHSHVNLLETEGGYFELARLTREVTAITGACFAVRRSLFEAVGGLDEAFQVAFNDIVFCMDVRRLGFRNIYVADPLLIHHESKSRGRDDTPQKIALSRLEARLAWVRHVDLLRDDPSYSPCLSLDDDYQLSVAPRRRALWSQPSNRPLKIIVLAARHTAGHGVAIIARQQIAALTAAGYEVVVGGPVRTGDFAYPDCERVDVVNSPAAAASAVELEVDFVIAHSAEFFSVVRWLGNYAPVIIIEHGERPSHFFFDPAIQRDLIDYKDASLLMGGRVLAISQSVARESRTPIHMVLPMGNTQLGHWDALSQGRRARTRETRGWTDRFIVLNVTRFYGEERYYKGIDSYIETAAKLRARCPYFFSRCTFVLCGKGEAKDIAAMRTAGLTVVANVSDEEMMDLYAAADAYANFSRWKGHNLGIGLASAMGLPVVASDIAAHREAGIQIVRDTDEAVQALIDIERNPRERVAKIVEWGPGIAMLIQEIERLYRDVEAEEPGLNLDVNHLFSA